MIHIKRSISLHPQLIRGAKGEYYNFLIRVSCGGARCNFSIGVTAPVYNYDKVSKQFVGDAINSDEAVQCRSMLNAMNEVFVRYEVIECRVPTMREVQESFASYCGRVERLDRTDLFQYAIDEFMSEQSADKSWSDSTFKKFTSLKNHFKDFDPDLRFSSFTEQRFAAFMKHLSKGMVNTTLTKYVRFVSWFLNWGASKGYYKGDAHKTFKPKYKGGDFEFKDVVYLTQEELAVLESMEFTRKEQYLERVRDVFLFACYSSLRWSDINALRRESVVDDCINIISSIKTGVHLRINLNKHTRAIIAKYRDCKFEGNRLLPVVSNQKTNDYLHELLRKAGFDAPQQIVWYEGNRRKEAVIPRYEAITFHCARKTFITHALRLKMPLPVIMKFSGHTSTRMLKPYMAVVDDLRQSEMAKFDEM